MNACVYEIPFDKLTYGHRIVIYGAGKVGEILWNKISFSNCLDVVAVIDQNPEGKFIGKNICVLPPAKLKDLDFDHVVIAVESEDIAQSMIEKAESFGVSRERIIWNGYSEKDNEARKYHELSKFFERNIKKKEKTVFLFVLPEHGNTGDYAIGCAEREFFKAFFPSWQIVTVTTHEWIYASNYIIPLVKDGDLVCLNGGGYIGDLWEGDSDVYRGIIEAFPKNRVIMMPNTFSFKNEPDKDNSTFLDEVAFFKKHKNCIVFFRDERSYQMSMKMGMNSYLFPDMAFFLKPVGICTKKTDKILLCLRKDREQAADVRNVIISTVTDLGYGTDELDIKLDRFYPWDDADLLVSEICGKIREYDLLITDRLHAMVLSVVNGVPCLAFDNTTHKVSGVFKWISDCSYARLLCTADVNNLRCVIDDVLSKYKQNEARYRSLDHYFSDMAELISGLLMTEGNA